MSIVEPSFSWIREAVRPPVGIRAGCIDLPSDWLHDLGKLENFFINEASTQVCISNGILICILYSQCSPAIGTPIKHTSFLKCTVGWAQWLTPVTPAFWGAKAGGLLELESTWPTWQDPVSTKSTKICWAKVQKFGCVYYQLLGRLRWEDHLSPGS